MQSPFILTLMEDISMHPVSQSRNVGFIPYFSLSLLLLLAPTLWFYPACLLSLSPFLNPSLSIPRALWLWESHLTFLSLSFLPWKWK